MPDAAAPARKLLVLDTAFTYEMMQARRLEHSVTCRDLGGFFAHVWTVHPFATMLTSDAWGPRSGRLDVFPIDGRHTVVEGKVGRFRALERLFPVNFVLGQLALFRRLSRLIRRERIGVVRAGDPLYLGLFGWMLARWNRVPLVVRVGANNDKIRETTKQPIQPRLLRSVRVERAIEGFVLKRADLVAGANKDNLAFAIGRGAVPARATLFRYGNLIDRAHFVAPRERTTDPARFAELAIEPGRFLLYVGRLEPVKHPDDVVRVLAEVRRRGHDVTLVLAGDGRMRQQIEALARTLGVEADLRMPGNRDQAWLSEMIPHAAAIVSPHTGRALSEAALGAAPVAAYDIDWQGELIETGVTGILVSHGDRTALADAVDTLLTDRIRARALGEALRARALDMLDPATLDAHERDQYERLLQARAGRRETQGDRG